MDYFLPFYPPNSPKNQNFEKMKKTPGDIILHMCTKNYDQMMYSSWDMVHDRCNYFSFGPLFALTAQKIKIFKKWKKRLEISSFYIWVPKIMIRWCTVPGIWCTTDGQTDGWMDERTNEWKKWHIEVGVPPKNIDMPRQKPWHIPTVKANFKHWWDIALQTQTREITKKWRNFFINDRILNNS